MPNGERTRLQERIIEIRGHSDMRGSVSASESGMFMVTELTLLFAQGGGTEGRADSLDWGVNMHMLFAEKETAPCPNTGYYSSIAVVHLAVLLCGPFAGNAARWMA